MSDLYIGLMSGTSADGIDAALVDFSSNNPAIIATYYTAYTSEVREKILALCATTNENAIHALGELDVLLGAAFGKAVNELLAQTSFSAQSIAAIGCHGQTIRHHPYPPYRFTLQIGDPNTIATLTGITTIADFRRKDMAHSGQGAPLVPAFHQAVFHSQKDRAIVNIGGIANVTLLFQDQSHAIIGFDTGPGNVLLDAWISHHHKLTQDKNGTWAARGKCHEELLQIMLSDDYFHKTPPKSTGREYFTFEWIENNVKKLSAPICINDVQTTLVDLTAISILNSIKNYMHEGEIVICGGGAHNEFLMLRLQKLAQPHFLIRTTDEFGIHTDWVEAVAFAWLAKQTLHRLPGNVPSVTGAAKTSILGGVYFA